MNKTDEEIILILKETFFSKSELRLPDDRAKSSMLKMLFFTATIGVIALVGYKIFAGEIPPLISSIVSFQLAMFFGVLFIHLNAKSKNPSIILFGLTWVSMVLSMFLANT